MPKMLFIHVARQWLGRAFKVWKQRWLSQDSCIMNRPRPLGNAVGDSEITVTDNLQANTPCGTDCVVQ